MALYKRADQRILEKPKPYDNRQGWVMVEGHLQPEWSSGPILPSSLLDVLGSTEMEEEEEEIEEIEEVDFDEEEEDIE